MSGTDQSANSGAGPVRAGMEFDTSALTGWMSAHVDGFSGPIRVTQFNGGQSNPTYKIDANGKSYVLRRKPLGVTLKGAHAIEREVRVLEALGRSGFPVPHVHGLCMDDTVLGSWFYIMDMVEGRIFWDATIPGVRTAERPSYFNALCDTMARLHTFDHVAAGLADFGRTGNFFERQIKRWSKQYRDDAEAGQDPNMDLLIEALEARIPEDDETCLVHGDFRCDNVIFHPTEPRILAVLDWELSTLGNPLADFAYHALMYRMPPNIVAGLVGADLAALNIPTEGAYLADYCARTGRQVPEDWDFYLAFNFFRLAAIFHGIKGRVIRGTASSANASARAESFPVLARLGRETLGN
ncbi:MAG: phosphotransferase [Pseudomonadota bacterium]|nr:phosphotransferase [Pseudomonadota bacterium]